jgi:serine/threonine-protein kinase RsbT
MTLNTAEPVTFDIANDADILRARTTVRVRARELRFSLVKQTKLVTAVSEIARNASVYGGGGRLTMETLQSGRRVGLRVIISDEGPGIANVEQALQDHFSSGNGMGLGLGGARRLVDEFELDTQVDSGTRVALTCWR